MDAPRASGLLLHVTSLPSPYGVGDLGPGAFGFVDFLADAGQRVWQMLPVVPTSGFEHSPYSSPSTFAGSPLLISPERLLDQGLLRPEDVADRPAFINHRVDYERAVTYKRRLLARAFDHFDASAGAETRDAFDHFCHAESGWLNDYALFMALKEHYGYGPWTTWPEALALRDPDALAQARHAHARDVRMRQYWQFLFDRQWRALRDYAHARDVRIFGDLPIYVAHDSADVWAHPHFFHLDASGAPTVVAGVPPDYFSATGQRWGNPLYRWDVMSDDGFSWWTRRLDRALALYDLIRLDHFRGFAAYWEVPAHESTAIHGRWVDGPGAAFFDRIEARLGRLPIVAENLGIITDDVTALMEQFGFPGMAVLQFAFGGDADSGYLPHNYTRHLVAYTGTHDNDTLVGWWMHPDPNQSPDHARRERAHALHYLDLDPDDVQEFHWQCVRLLLASVARLVVVPVQDLLGLGSPARMNTPGREGGNWTWRLLPDQLTTAMALRLRRAAQLYGRTPDRHPPLPEA